MQKYYYNTSESVVYKHNNTNEKCIPHILFIVYKYLRGGVFLCSMGCLGGGGGGGCRDGEQGELPEHLICQIPACVLF